MYFPPLQVTHSPKWKQELDSIFTPHSNGLSLPTAGSAYKHGRGGAAGRITMGRNQLIGK